MTVSKVFRRAVRRVAERLDHVLVECMHFIPSGANGGVFLGVRLKNGRYSGKGLNVCAFCKITNSVISGIRDRFVFWDGCPVPAVGLGLPPKPQGTSRAGSDA